MTYKEIISDLDKKLYHPVYFFWGDEPYYVDLLSQYIEKNVLEEGEREFNQMIFYGRDQSMAEILDAAYRFPMMSNYQVIMVKEAQDIRDLLPREDENGKVKGNKNMLLDYLDNPMKSTILVFCYKYKKIDMRTSLGKKLSKKAVFFESKKIWDDKVPGWIEDYLKAKNYIIGHKAVALLAEYLGSDLSKIANELGKLMINLAPPAEITVSDIERNIGISKDFNIFELQHSLADRDIAKSLRIAEYFAANQKENPFVVCMSSLYNYFSKLLLIHSLRDRSRNNVAAKLGVNPYFVSDYEKAARTFSPAALEKVFNLLREYDLKSKGVDNTMADETEIYREFVLRLIYLDKVKPMVGEENY